MKSDEIGGDSYTALYWEYDARTGRRWNVDPVMTVGESPYLTFGGNPIINVDPNGNDWYKNNKNGNVEYKANWHKKHKGYESLGKGNGDWLNYSGKDYNKKTGEVSTTLESVTVTGTRKKDNSLMEQMLQVSNVTQESRDAYNASHPRPSEASVWKTVFWDAGVGALNPIKDVDIYASAAVKQKEEYGGGFSRTVVATGGQVGATTEEGGKLQYSFLDLRNSYGSWKVGGNELRVSPLVGIGSNNQSLFGDYAPVLRTLTDFNFRGIPCQFETGMGLKKLKFDAFVGVRAKEEINLGFGRSAEVVVGARLHLDWPAIIKAFMK